jgi:hypothetical protein
MSTTQISTNRLLPKGGLQPDQVQTHLEGLLGSLIKRNQSTKGSRLEPVLTSVQNAITQRIMALSEAPKAAAPAQSAPVDWGRENIRLQTFYGFLRNHPSSSGVAFRLCEAIRMDADHRIQPMLRTQGNPMGIIHKAREDIGKVVFVADRALSTPNSYDPDAMTLGEAVTHIDQQVQDYLREDLKQLMEKNDRANDFELQDPDMFLFIEKPKTIANLLLTSEGQLNLGLISKIKSEWFAATNLLEYEQGILYVLDQMDTTWQSAIDAIQPPSKTQSPSNTLIRADLGMDPKENITQRHCQQLVLGALLSQLNQGPVGDCFAVSWAIKKHNEFLLNSVADYAAILRDGFLTRNVNGVPDHFFFETTIADDAFTAQLTLRGTGWVDEFKGKMFWECPNMIAAAKQMGIPNLVALRTKILEKIFNFTNKPKTMTCGDLIQYFAKTIVENTDHPEHSEDELAMLGKYGFSLSNNRLLRAWEASLAAMAEDRHGDYVRDNVSDCVMKVLKPVFDNSEKKAGGAYQKTLIEEFKKIFQTTMNNSFRLVYNGSIPLQHISSDGSSSSGGFELYKRDVEDLTNKGVRVATPDQFRDFVFVMIDQATKAELGKVSSSKDRKVISSVSDALKLCAHGNNFKRDLLWAYDEANREVEDPALHFGDLERTPMTSLDGDNPWEVEAIDTGKDFTPDVKTIKPKDPGALLQWLLGLASWKESTKQYLDEDTATSPQHAFNIEFENEEFKAFLGSKLSPDQWIKKALVDPGQKISRSEMSSAAKAALQEKIKGWLSDQFNNPIPGPVMQNVDQLFSTLNTRYGVTVQQYSQRVHDGLVKIFRFNKDHSIAFSLAFDQTLIRSLPQDQRKAIESQAVRFAKTNWNRGPENLFFCCFFNPRTEKVDFADIAENHTGLEPMDQFEWIDDLDWEVDPVAVKS